MFRQAAEQVRLDLVFFLLGVVAGHLAAGVAPRLFDHAGFAEEVGAFERAFLVGGFEDESVAQIEREDAGFFATERRDERGGGLRSGDDGRNHRADG